MLTLSNTEKDLQRLAYLKTQSDLQNEQLLKQQTEKQNQLQSTQLKSLKQETAINKLNQQKQWSYIIAGFILLALSFVYFFNRSRLQGVKLETQLIQEKAEQERKDSEFQRKLADISMSALRSQMNPHFIFNCLNSIKLYTTQNDIAAASEYLTKFAKLIRLVLENSRSDHITLSSELAALELYIQMEAMRFKQKLSYDVVIEDNVEIGANSTIDRATMGSTLIRAGAKLDNLIQVAHNVEVGHNTVIAAQAGVSGSTKIGKNVMIGGQAGIVGHIQIADGSKINAQSGVSKSIKSPNSSVTGSPAFDYASALRAQAVSRNLPELERRIIELENLVKQLLAERV